MGFSGVFVPGAGIEPARDCSHWFLRPTRLPVPPSGHYSLNFALHTSHFALHTSHFALELLIGGAGRLQK